MTKSEYGQGKLLPLALATICLLACGMGCSEKSGKAAGRILSIDLPKHGFKPGETLKVYVKIRNDGEEKAHFLVALNVLYGDDTVYDSHHGKKSHRHDGDECLDARIDAGVEKRIGPFVYRIPSDARTGTYHVLVGLRQYPWEPVLEYRGAPWCAPETTFEVRR